MEKFRLSPQKLKKWWIFLCITGKLPLIYPETSSYSTFNRKIHPYLTFFGYLIKEKTFLELK